MGIDDANPQPNDDDAIEALHVLLMSLHRDLSGLLDDQADRKRREKRDQRRVGTLIITLLVVLGVLGTALLYRQQAVLDRQRINAEQAIAEGRCVNQIDAAWQIALSQYVQAFSRLPPDPSRLQDPDYIAAQHAVEDAAVELASVQERCYGEP